MGCRCAAAAGVLAVLGAGLASGQRGGVYRESRDHPAIRYTDGTRNDAVAALNRAVQSGAVALAFEPTTGYLRSVLDALDIPIESQVTVFSETSFQARWVTPESPRAIYFNDTVAVGWVRDADVLEIASLDATQGVGFYSLDQQPAERPELQRNEQCLACHLSWDTLGVPGLMTLNTLPLPDDPNAYAVGWVTDHRSPLEDRWGSWYVTGAPPSLRHLGNRTEPFEYIPGGGDPAPVLDTLEGVVDLDGYPTPYSDLVALMVLEHRNHMTNLLVRLGWQARVDDHAGAAGGRTAGGPSAPTVDEAAVEARRLSAVRGRGAAAAGHRQHVGLRRGVLVPGPLRRPGTRAPPARPRRPAAAVSVQPPRVRRRLRRPAGARPRRRVPPDVDGPVGGRDRAALRTAVPRRPHRRRGDPARHQAESARHLPGRDSLIAIAAHAAVRSIMEILRDTKPNLPDILQGEIR